MSLQDDQSHLHRTRELLESSMTELSALLGKEGSGMGESGGATASQLPKHVHFKIFRDYIEHEDGLVNNRLLWNINIQGFLFATFGFSVQKLAELDVQAAIKGKMIAAPSLISLGLFMYIILPGVGILISICSWFGVRAAQCAIAQLAYDWHKAEAEHKPNAVQLPEMPKLPGMIGGGHTGENHVVEWNHAAHKDGFYAPLWFPWIFVAAWFLVVLSYFGPLGPWLWSEIGKR